MSEFNIKAELYDEFKDHVIGLRDRANPRLDLREFDTDQAKRSGPTHVKFILENVDSAIKHLFTGVESFRHGTVMKSEEDLRDGSPIWAVYIPFKNIGGKKSSSSGRSGEGSFPNVMLLYGYIFLIMLIIMFAMGFTKREDWRFLF